MAMFPLVSATWTIMLYAPVLDGVPLIVPLDATVRPGGRVEFAAYSCVQVSDPVPPVAASEAVYDVPTTALGIDNVVIWMGVTIRTKLFTPTLAEFEASVASTSIV